MTSEPMRERAKAAINNKLSLIDLIFTATTKTDAVTNNAIADVNFTKNIVPRRRPAGIKTNTLKNLLPLFRVNSINKSNMDVIKTERIKVNEL